MATTPANPESDEDGFGAAKAFLGVLIAFKLITVVLIFWHLSTWQAGLVLGATTWYWFPLMGALAAGPILFRYRLRRVRARRDRLRRAEWMLGQDQDDQVDDRAGSRR